MESARVVEKVTGPRARTINGGLPPDDPLRAFDGQATDFGFKGDSLEEVFGQIIESWPISGISEHLSLEIAVVHRRGRSLGAGALVPGCTCEGCTGITSEAPAWTRRTPSYARKMENRASWEARVDEARAVPLLEVVQRLGLGDPVKKGKEFVVPCPLHEDKDPSLQLNAGKQLWYCHPCGTGGDALQLLMRVRRIEFAEAVRELAA